MTAYLLAGHLLNLVAPAALMALLLAALARLLPGFFGPRPPAAKSWWVQAAINFAIGAAVLVAGLVLFGRDGKLLTYVVLVLATAAGQWCQLAGWRR